MASNLVVLEEPTAEPVSVPECKTHMRVETTDDDALIEGLIPVARRIVENETGRQLITAKLAVTFPHFPHDRTNQRSALYRVRPLYLPAPPLQSVQAVKYFDPDGAEQTIDSTTYTVRTKTFEGAVTLKPGLEWPETQHGMPDAVTVEFTAGYGDEPQKVEGPLRLAIKMLVAHFYANREATSQASTMSGPVLAVPMAVDLLIAPYRSLVVF